MIVNTEKKYSPKSLDEFIFPNEEARELVTAFSSGEMERPLILYGSSGSGKSLLQRLIPQAIERKETQVNKVICSDLKLPRDIHDLYGRNKHFNRNFTFDGQRFNYFIIEEFLITNKKIVDTLKIELEDTLGTDLTIISTNRFEEIDSGIVSRCESLKLMPCDPSTFFLHAKKMFDFEGIELDDKLLKNCLSATYTLHKDNRKYYSAIDSIFRKF
jgi:replication-associated recombination protein RarA